jgi:quinol-cytochrome oxidoreductase complex cytochrome b subunit
MFQYIWLIFLLLFGLVSILASIKLILIGKNKINDPKYNDEEKKKNALIIGIICIIPLILCELFFIIAAYFIFFA